MIPLSDEGVRRRGFPIATIAIIGICAVVFLYELSLGDRRLQGFVLSYGAVPLEITTGRDFPPPGPPIIWLSLFTSMFIHGGWAHFLGNMLYLWVFGDNVEDALGSLAYVFFYLVSGLAASWLQILSDPHSPYPAIGASGAIAGVLGAYLLLFPGARVNTLVVFGFFLRMVSLPAFVLLGFWFVLQFFSGMASIGIPTGVAYWAHVGGFVAGMLMALPIALRRRRGRRVYD